MHVKQIYTSEEDTLPLLQFLKIMINYSSGT